MVASDIHFSAPMSSFRTASSVRTISWALAFAAGGKYRWAYTRPRGSPSKPSVDSRQRIARGFGAIGAAEYLSMKAKDSSAKGFETTAMPAPAGATSGTPSRPPPASARSSRLSRSTNAASATLTSMRGSPASREVALPVDARREAAAGRTRTAAAPSWPESAAAAGARLASARRISSARISSAAFPAGAVPIPPSVRTLATCAPIGLAPSAKCFSSFR